MQLVIMLKGKSIIILYMLFSAMPPCTCMHSLLLLLTLTHCLLPVESLSIGIIRTWIAFLSRTSQCHQQISNMQRVQILFWLIYTIVLVLPLYMPLQLKALNSTKGSFYLYAVDIIFIRLENNINYILGFYLIIQIFKLRWFIELISTLNDQVVTNLNFTISIYLIKIKHKIMWTW